MSAEHRLTRRKVVVSAAGLAFAGLVSKSGVAGIAQAGTTPFSPGFTEIVVGRIQRLIDDRDLEVLTADGPQVVHFTDGALFWRERPADLAAFSVGEEVVIEGSSESGSFVGNAMINVYEVIEAPIVGKRGTRLRTPKGQIDISDSTRYEHEGVLSPVPANKVRVGADVVALGRVDASSGDLITFRIY